MTDSNQSSNASAPASAIARRFAVLTIAALFAAAAAGMALTAVAENPKPTEPSANAAPSGKTETAIFASGCFWCTESDFDKVPGVLKTTPGYTGGSTPNPTYETVGTGRTGHTEALQVVYDPEQVTYQKLLTWYWRHVDPVDGNGQFCDRGSQYRPAIIVNGPEQRKLAEASKEALQKSGLLKRPIAVEITDAAKFTPAEEYHHDYYQRNPLRYKIYRHGCGRDQRIEQIWRNASG